MNVLKQIANLFFSLVLATWVLGCSMTTNDREGCIRRSQQMFTAWAKTADGKPKPEAIPDRASAERFCDGGFFEKGMTGMTAVGGAPPWVAGSTIRPPSDPRSVPENARDPRWFGGQVNLDHERRDPCAPGMCNNFTARGEAGAGSTYRRATVTECVNCGEGQTRVHDRFGNLRHAEDMRRDIQTGDMWWRSTRPAPTENSQTQRAIDQARDRLTRDLIRFDDRRR